MSRLIDADAMKAKYGEWYTEEGFAEGFIGTIGQLLDAQPTIEERKTGKWIPYLSNGLTVMCSECGSRFDRPWHHCPNCGAKMEGEKP